MGRKKYKVKVSKDDVRNFPATSLKPDPFWAEFFENAPKDSKKDIK